MSHQNTIIDTVLVQYKCTECTVSKYCSDIVAFYKRKKKIQTERKKKVTTVATVPHGTVATIRSWKKKKSLTKTLLPLQCLHSTNTLSAQYRSTVAALPLFIYKISASIVNVV